jgi:hypothetical protein
MKAAIAVASFLALAASVALAWVAANDQFCEWRIPLCVPDADAELATITPPEASTASGPDATQQRAIDEARKAPTRGVTEQKERPAPASPSPPSASQPDVQPTPLPATPSMPPSAGVYPPPPAAGSGPQFGYGQSAERGPGRCLRPNRTWYRARIDGACDDGGQLDPQSVGWCIRRDGSSYPPQAGRCPEG